MKEESLKKFNLENTQNELNGFMKVKPKLCIICNEPTPGGSVCSDICFEKFEKFDF